MKIKTFIGNCSENKVCYVVGKIKNRKNCGASLLRNKIPTKIKNIYGSLQIKVVASAYSSDVLHPFHSYHVHTIE